MSDIFQPGQALPGTTANTDATSLSSTYQMTKADLATKIIWDGQQTTIGHVIDVFENMSPSQMAGWEQNLVAAGLQAAGTVGDPQARTDAFNSFLRFLAYNQAQNPGDLTRSQAPGFMGPLPSSPTSITPDALMRQLIAENPGAALDKRGLSAAGAGVKIHLDLSNPLDVKQLGDAVANKLIGRDLTSQEAMAITSTIRAQQTASGQGELAQEQSLLAAQTAATTGQPGQTGGGVITTQAPTSAEAATTQYLTQHDQGDVQAHSLLNVFEAIKQKVETDAQGTGPRAATGPMKVV